jgi:HlyD family secretion protein
MSPTMFFGRVVLPVAGLAVAVSLSWSTMKKFAAQAEPIDRPGSSASHLRSSGRITAEGRVVAYPGAEVTVGTEVAGTIINMSVQENAVVRKGDLIAELRSDDVKASLREAHFRLIEAETGLRLLRARFQLDRVLTSPTTTPRPANNRVDEEGAAVARRDAAKATVERLEAEAVKYRIVSPIGGVVVFRQVDPGETLTPGSPLVTIVDLTRLRVEADVDEFDIAGIKLGAKATIRAEGYTGHRWEGQVEEIPLAVVNRQTRPEDPGRLADTRALRVKIAFRGSNPLKLGQHVEVEIASSDPRVDDGIRTRDTQIHNLVP